MKRADTTLRCCALAAALAITAPASAQTADAGDDSRVVYERATELARAGRLEEARQLYLELWQRHQTYDTALNLAQIAFASGDYVSAAEYATFGLEQFPPSERPRLREHFSQLLRDSQQHVATVTVEAPEGAEIRVDDRPRGTAPLPRLFLEPGTHHFTATEDGKHIAREVALTGGNEVEVTLAFQQTTPATTAPPPDAASAPPRPAEEVAPTTTHPPSLRTVLVLTGTALTTASLAAHVGLRVKARGLDDDVDTLRRDALWGVGEGGCADDSTRICTELADTLDRRDRTGRWVIGTFATTIVFGAATVAAAVWPAKGRTEARMRYTPWVTGRGAGLAVERSF